MAQRPIYGLMAEFDAPEKILAAAERARDAGYKKMDAFTPFPMEELTQALGVEQSKLSLFVLCCGIAGGLTGFFLPYFVSVIDYPLNIGGRPLNSWPHWIPVTFELTVLFAAFGAVVGMIFRNGLPRPVHPVFNVDRFELATQDRFFLCIESTDARFDRSETERFMKSLNPTHLTVVDDVEK
jgi:Alternative complex III, ActD subunit